MSKKRIPVASGLFVEAPEGARLVGSRCRTCKTPYFPKSAVCHNPECKGSHVEDALFGPTGTVWSVAVQDYPPPPPAKFDKPYQPYAMGVVDLDDGLRVLGRMTSSDPRSVQVGARVELVIDALCHDDEGNEIVSWKFKS
ncbi:MAG TPA: OB-fold domain-containing protein [Candidatus Binatia bacterium]|nr:OB-fold domain-containing protein [Candidatus Binatia bacterium]